MTRVIVERSYIEPLTDAALAAMQQSVEPCLSRHGVRWLNCRLSADRLRMVCEYEAPDAESVRIAQRDARTLFDL